MVKESGNCGEGDPPAVQRRISAPNPETGRVPGQRAWVHGPVRRPVEPFRQILPVADAGLGQRAARPAAARAGVGAVAVVALVVHVPAGPHCGAGAPVELALRTCALGRHSWLPTHRRPFASADSPSLCGPPERMWTDAACSRPPPRRDLAHDPAAAGPPISPRSSDAPRGPPRSPRTGSASINSPGAPPGPLPAPRLRSMFDPSERALLEDAYRHDRERLTSERDAKVEQARSDVTP